MQPLDNNEDSDGLLLTPAPTLHKGSFLNGGREQFISGESVGFVVEVEHSQSVFTWLVSV